MVELTLRPARPDEAGRVAHALASAFVDEPSVVAMLGRGRGVTNKLIQLLQLQLGREYLPNGVVDLALSDGEIAGVAMWSSPESRSASVLAQLRMVPAYLNILGRQFWHAAGLETRSLRSHPGHPHWYLYMLGVVPEFQRRGIGDQLLAHRLGLMADDQPVYLEASTTDSMRLYERHGFVQVNTLSLGNGHSLQGMWRPAAQQIDH